MYSPRQPIRGSDGRSTGIPDVGASKQRERSRPPQDQRQDQKHSTPISMPMYATSAAPSSSSSSLSLSPPSLAPSHTTTATGHSSNVHSCSHSDSQSSHSQSAYSSRGANVIPNGNANANIGIDMQIEIDDGIDTNNNKNTTTTTTTDSATDTRTTTITKSTLQVRVPFRATGPYTNKTKQEQIEALEQALKLQVERRMDVESKLHSQKYDIQNIKQTFREKMKKQKEGWKKQMIQNNSSVDGGHDNNDNNENHILIQIKELIQHMKTKQQPKSSSSSPSPQQSSTNNQEQIKEFSELLSDFIHEMDGLDGDESEATIQRSDVLWFLNELLWRFNMIQDSVNDDLDTVEYFMKRLIVIIQDYHVQHELKKQQQQDQQQEQKQQQEHENVVEDDEDDDFSEDESGDEHVHNKGGDEFSNGSMCASNKQPTPINNNIHTSSSTNQELLKEKEIIISTLEGRIVQLEENIATKNDNHNSTTGQGIINSYSESSRCQSQSQRQSVGESPSESSQQYKKLMEKYKHLESRHRNIITEMQSSVNAKNEDVRQLKKDLKMKDEVITNQNIELQSMRLHLQQPPIINTMIEGRDLDQSNDDDACIQAQQKQQQQQKQQFQQQELEIKSLIEDVEERNGVIQEMKVKIKHLSHKIQHQHQPPPPPPRQRKPPPPPPITTTSTATTAPKIPLYKELEIKSLKEDIEERDKVIEELREEINKFKQQMKPSLSRDGNNVRLRYLEGIVRDLEQKLSKANNGGGGCSNGDCTCRPSPRNTSRYLYGELDSFDFENSPTTSMVSDDELL